MTNEWMNPDHSAAYLARKHDIPHRIEGESTLLSEVPVKSKRVLDLGCGDGHLLSLVLDHCDDATGVGLDLSQSMLDQARHRCEHDRRVSFIEHDMDEALPALGNFDCVVSSFAIHHCSDERKRSLYAEVFELLAPGGIFCNLEHVSSPNERIHARFVQAMNMKSQDEDPSNKLLDVETQLGWLKDIGFDDVDCYWKWRELALLIGWKPFKQSRNANFKELAFHEPMNTSQFQLFEVVTRQQEAGESWREFLSVPSLTMGVYMIPAGTDDHATHHAHDRDEVYVGISGKGCITVDGKKYDVSAEAVVFVKAGVKHHFHDVSEDLTVLVFFAGQTDLKSGQ